MAHVCNPNRGKDQMFKIHDEFAASLGYTRFSLKTNKNVENLSQFSCGKEKKMIIKFSLNKGICSRKCFLLKINLCWQNLLEYCIPSSRFKMCWMPPDLFALLRTAQTILSTVLYQSWRSAPLWSAAGKLPPILGPLPCFTDTFCLHYHLLTLEFTPSSLQRHSIVWGLVLWLRYGSYSLGLLRLIVVFSGFYINTFFSRPVKYDMIIW